MIKVIKIGGNVVDNPAMLDSFCRDFASLEGPKVLVHGGGVLASSIQKALGHEAVKIEGRRVTDEETLKTVTMVYSGWCNKNITAKLQAYGCNAIGLSGCDASVIKAVRRSPKLLSDGVTLVDYGFVGDVKPESVNTAFLQSLFDLGLVPVLCAINHDGKGQLLNTNADTIASSVAAALKASLTYCFEKEGVLYDKDDEGSVIPVIDTKLYERLKAEGRVAEGMIPKLDNSFQAMRQGVQEVIIKHASRLNEHSGSLLTLTEDE